MPLTLKKMSQNSCFSRNRCSWEFMAVLNKAELKLWCLLPRAHQKRATQRHQSTGMEGSILVRYNSRT